MRTQIGLIASMLQAVQEEATPLQRRLDELGKTLGWAALVICGVVFVIGLARGQDLALRNRAHQALDLHALARNTPFRAAARRRRGRRLRLGARTARDQHARQGCAT
jgi:hypothetical protein